MSNAASSSAGVAGVRQGDRPLRGVALAALGYGLFSIQDAIVKALVETYSVAEILFLRSLLIVVIALVIGRAGTLAAVRESRAKTALLARAALILVAWLLYYSAARDIPLAQLTTIYFAAPIMVVVMAALVLREKVPALRWAAVCTGFVGVILAVDPAGTPALVPAVMALVAAACWAVSVILARVISRTESTTSQMLVSNVLFAVPCALAMPALWVTPDLAGVLLLLGLGAAGGLGQFVVYEGFRHAPAALLAPIEYTGLVWAFLFGWAIWAEVPTLGVVAGAVLIVGGSLVLVWSEWKAAGAQARRSGRG